MKRCVIMDDLSRFLIPEFVSIVILPAARDFRWMGSDAGLEMDAFRSVGFHAATVFCVCQHPNACV